MGAPCWHQTLRLIVGITGLSSPRWRRHSERATDSGRANVRILVAAMASRRTLLAQVGRADLARLPGETRHFLVRRPWCGLKRMPVIRRRPRRGGGAPRPAEDDDFLSFAGKPLARRLDEQSLSPFTRKFVDRANLTLMMRTALAS